MHLSIDIPLKPISLNSCYSNKPGFGRFKNQSYRDYEKSLLLEIEKNEEYIRNWAIAFLALDFPCMVATYEVGIFDLFTKDGHVNLKSGDIFNFPKVTEDIITKYIKSAQKNIIGEAKKTCKYIDDSQVLMGIVDKWKKVDSLKVSIQAMELEDYATINGFDVDNRWLKKV